jgi:GAF domain-containing protein
MVAWISRTIFNLNKYTDPTERRRAAAAYGILSLLSLLLIVNQALVIFNVVETPAQDAAPLLTLRPLLALAGIAVVFVLLRLGMLKAAALVILSVMLVIQVVSMALVGWQYDALTVFPALVAAISALIAPGWLALVVSLLSTSILAVAMLSTTWPLTLSMSLALIQNLVVGLLTFLLARGWRRSMVLAGEQTTRHRLRMAELSAEVTQRVFQHMDLQALLNETVDTIRERFPEIYHAQVFLIDAQGKNAVLKASTGDVGARLIARKHTLGVGSQSVIGQVTGQGYPVLAADTSTDIVHRRNELLPNTRAELALPLVSARGIIGALDVQSLQPEAFLDEDVAVLQTLANQIAVAIENANILAAEQQAQEENRLLAEQAQQQLAQIQTLNQQLTHQAWTSFIHSREFAPALTVDFDSGTMTPNAELTPSLSGAIQAGKPVEDGGPEGQTLAVPLTVRGQVVGAMEFELDASGRLSPEQRGLVEDVADRLALALENNRLYEESQRLARRQSILNEIGGRLQGAAGIESALIVAAQGLQGALNAPRIAIRLGNPLSDQPASQEVDA